MCTAAPCISRPWVVLGDFNLTYEARDKNNLNLNRRLMGKFRATINRAELFEIRCKNRKFTWSNEQQSPTLVALDRVFCNPDWDSLFPSHLLHAASTSVSDHCPLILSNACAPARRSKFLFENFWPKFPGFREVVAHAWTKPVRSSCALNILQTKLQRTAKALKTLVAAVAREVRRLRIAA